MNVEFCYDIGRTRLKVCDMSQIPCVGDHVDIHNSEWIVTGRLFNSYGVDSVKIYVKKATSNDITFMS